ncbi:MAG TPA: hypothetical protein VF546_19695 [Pyrinomonadaceae bacterium]|jgi:hypothetical protein
MKRHLLGILIALAAFALGAYLVIYRDPCKAPWRRCDPPAQQSRP